MTIHAYYGDISHLKNEQKMFDDLFNFVDSLRGSDIASKLGQIKDAIEDERGYSGVIAPINLSISSLKFNEDSLSSSETNDLIRRDMPFFISPTTEKGSFNGLV